MKKIFISFLALVAIVGVANAQRTWAYDLNSTSEGDGYTFEFKSTTAATAANLVLIDVNGEVVSKVALQNVVAGKNTATLTLAQIHKDALNWAVELTGEAIAELTEVTDVNRGIYNFYLPQDVAVDNNPESDYFGRIYVAEATDGADDGGSERADTQKRGIFVYDQELNELNPTTNVGILPSNVTLTDQSRQALHRMSINPVNNHVAFCYNVEGASAVWSMDPANLGGDAVNLIEGLAITKANALCFDEEGTLYVMDNANTSDGGKIVKVVNGELVTIAQNGIWGVQDLSLVSDGRGGLWIAQNRWAVDDYAVLSHVNAAGVIDYSVVAGSADAGMFPNDANASYRGQCAYNAAEDVLAFGGNKVVTLFKVTYDAETGVPALEKLHVTPTLGSNIDGVAFDYAGDLYALSASSERFYKFAVPTTNNTFTTPAKSSLVISGGTATSVDNVAISVDAQKIVRNGQVLIIRDGKTFNMLGQEVK